MVCTIHFYHLTTTPLVRALPKLLEKAYASGARVLVLAEDAQLERLNELLWTYDAGSFLPHGSVKDGHPASQPILLADHVPPSDMAGERNILCVTHGMFPPDPVSYARVMDIFDGNDPETLAAARQRWKQYQSLGLELHYYQQTEAGGWEKAGG